jgi:tubulin polyglutamylase TTLL5
MVLYGPWFPASSYQSKISVISYSTRYISKPLIINKRKFDLRVFVLVTSFEPLRAYIYKNGTCRFASEPYGDSKSKYSNLTNHSINKTNKRPKSGIPLEFDNKWSLEKLWEYLEESGVETLSIIKEIKSIVLKTLSSAHSPNVGGARCFLPPGNKDNCFELYGFDILIDKDLKAWLLEVNVSPALKSSSSEDYETKREMVSDLFNLIGVKMSKTKQARRRGISKKGDPIFTSGQTTSFSRRKSKFNLEEGTDSFLQSLNTEELSLIQNAEDEVCTSYSKL